ncbi:Hypothetical protein GLP15_2845 [Giardia lamblia P15]|uniref:Uncharacterized protein n=1 Tax=Giardia intestinalis (strain P15) TaxID=658858 RepID=E1F052_GIAIA|nr:Hypothetical protein GLP15_2845 [Giardia lamblia P15]
MLGSVFLPAYYTGTTDVINGLEDLAAQRTYGKPRRRYPMRSYRPAFIDTTEVEQEYPPPPLPPPLKPTKTLDFIRPPLQPIEASSQGQGRSVSERPTRHYGARAPILDASISQPPQILESLPKSQSFCEEPEPLEKPRRSKARISADRLNRLYKTYSRRFTAKVADQKRATSVTSKSQKKAEKDRETLEAITRIESMPCMFSHPRDLDTLAMQKAEVVRAISSRKGKKLTKSAASLAGDKSLHCHKSYLGKYYSLRYLDRIAECEADKAIIANAKKVAADVGLMDSSRTRLWAKITLDEDEEGYNISIRAPLDFLFEKSPVHDTLQTIYETVSERNVCT